MAQWRTYPELSASDIVGSDLLPISDESQPAGSRSAVTRVDTLRTVLAGAVTIREVTTNDTPTDADAGARLNVTDGATISLDDDLTPGVWFVVRAETADPVLIDVTGTATVSPAGPLELVPFTAALCTHLTGGAWQVEGAFVEGS